MASVQQQRQQQSYFVRLGSLSERLRQHAFEHSLAKLRGARQSAQEALQQLAQGLSLVSLVAVASAGGNPLWAWRGWAGRLLDAIIHLSLCSAK
jgi:hypothetical protein